MPTLDETLDLRVSALIEKGESIPLLSGNQQPLTRPTMVSHEGFAEWRSQSLSFIRSLPDDGGVYDAEFTLATDDAPQRNALQRGVGVLKALREDLRGGFLVRARTLIEAEVFADFLTMAEHLLAEQYKDPAAMLGGAVLEDGLRRIALKNSVTIATSDNLQSLADKILQAKVITTLTRKKLAYWIDVRDLAAHGHFTQYSENEVGELLRGITSFLEEHLG